MHGHERNILECVTKVVNSGTGHVTGCKEALIEGFPPLPKSKFRKSLLLKKPLQNVVKQDRTQENIRENRGHIQ